MAKLSITTAWNETAAFLKREAGLVLPIAFLLVALPGAALQLTMPMQAAGEPPQFGPLFLPLLLLAVVASLVGTIAMSYLALRPGTSVGEALQVGLRRFVMLFAASLLIGLGFVLVAIPLVLIVGGGGAITAGGDPAAMLGPILLVVLILAVLALLVWVRLIAMTPVAAAERVGPIGIIRRSWELTAGHFWKLLGFVILFLIAAFVLMVVVTAIVGILVFAVAGPPEPGSTSMILNVILSALLQALFSAVLVTMVARIYAQLSGGTPEEVFA